MIFAIMIHSIMIHSIMIHSIMIHIVMIRSRCGSDPVPDSYQIFHGASPSCHICSSCIRSLWVSMHFQKPSWR